MVMEVDVFVMVMEVGVFAMLVDVDAFSMVVHSLLIKLPEEEATNQVHVGPEISRNPEIYTQKCTKLQQYQDRELHSSHY